ncbi:MAG TPA: EAL domain-containing protein [Rhodocyclaceae bacterium]
MFRYLKSLPISTRFWLLVGFFSFAVLFGAITEITLHGKRLRVEREQQLEHLVENAYSILSYYHGEAQAGHISDAVARSQAANTVRQMRYREREYFWIHDLAQPVPRMVMHPTAPELEGRVLDQPAFHRASSSRNGAEDDFRPLNNENLFVAMNRVATSPAGRGFVAYSWPKPLAAGGVSVALYPKLSFVKRFEPWGWVIGSGIYMDEFEADYWRQAQFDLVKTGLWLLLFAVIAWLVMHTIVQPLRTLQASIDQLRKFPDGPVRLPTNQPAELQDLGDAFQSLIGELQESRKALTASLGELRLAGCAIDVMSEAVVVADAERRIVSINPAFTRISGYTPTEAIGQTVSLLKSGRHDAAFYRAMWNQLDNCGFWSGEIWNRAKDGRIYPEWLSITTSFDARGKVLNYVGVFSDITDRKHAETDLRIAATAFEAQEGMFITDARGVILRVNQAFSHITGYTAEEAVGETPHLLRSGRHDAAFYAAMWQAIEQTGSWQGEIWNRRKSGEIFPEWLTITAVRDGAGRVTHHVSTLTDITQRKAAENEIKHLAFYDPLTSLPNRRLLLDRLRHALSSSARSQRGGALLFIDLDNFKTLNDTLGHEKGDLLLQMVAQRLVGCVREGDTVARLGGDEFVVMLEGLSTDPDAAVEQTKAIGEKILAKLNGLYDLAGHEYHSSPSVGATVFFGHQHSVEELLKQADLAMYKSKAAGRNRLSFFDPDMQSVISARAVLEADLREAARDKQFCLYYQPQVDGAGKLIGAEALVRWQHPERGLVAPGEFIPLAEETGLILPLGQWVLESACRQLAAWAQQPQLAQLCMAVNVSAVQCRQVDFVDQVLAVIEATGANPQRLKLEVTESMLLHNLDDIIAKMLALKAKGVSFSLDDFGTGYSALTYLKQLPVDQLKIDRSFVRDLASNANDVAIARTIVALAESLGLTVIAEGVETEAQRQCLDRHGCHNYQGFFFGRPLPIEDFEKVAQQAGSSSRPAP